MVGKGYFQGQRSIIKHTLQLFMNNMQSSSGNLSMCQQVPMMFLLLLVYLSAAACISEEINFCPCWRRDVLTFKDQMSSTNHKMLLFVSWRNQYAIIRLATI